MAPLIARQGDVGVGLCGLRLLVIIIEIVEIADASVRENPKENTSAQIHC